MFEHIGGKIKSLAMICAVSGMIASVIGGFVVMDAAGIGTGLLIMVVGCVVSWVGSFMTYGFGQLIENTDAMAEWVRSQKQKEKAAEIHKRSEEGKSSVSRPAPAPAPVPVTAPQKAAEVPANKAVPVRVFPDAQGMIVCPACRSRQQSNRKVCYRCEQRFINGQTTPYWCGSCGEEGPYDGACPKCGSTLKVMNN